jgi:hypothetical protein
LGFDNGKGDYKIKRATLVCPVFHPDKTIHMFDDTSHDCQPQSFLPYLVESMVWFGLMLSKISCCSLLSNPMPVSDKQKINLISL